MSETTKFLYTGKKECIICGDRENLWLSESETPLCTVHYLDIMKRIEDSEGLKAIDEFNIVCYAKRLSRSPKK